jgi:hypothetical protein
MSSTFLEHRREEDLERPEVSEGVGPESAGASAYVPACRELSCSRADVVFGQIEQ